MNKSRDARFQSAGDLKQAIEKHLGLETLREASENLKSLLVTDGATMVLPRTERAHRTKIRLRRGLTAALVTGTLCVAAAGYVLAPDTIRGYIDEVRAFTGKAGEDQANIQRGDLLGAGLLDGYVEPVLPDSGAKESEDAAANTLTATAQPTRTPPRAAPTPPAALVVSTADSTANTRSSDGLTVATAVTGSTATKPKPSRVAKPVEAVKTGWLSIRTEPAAEIYVDGRYTGDTPASRIKLTSGSHTLECRSPKHETYHETIHITTGELSTRNIVLQKRVGRISLSTIDGAEVFVDGVLIGVTPLADPLELDAGKHQLTVKKAGYHVWNNVVTLEERQLLPLKITLSLIY